MGSIRLDSAGKEYLTAAGSVRAVDAISLEVEAGARVAITGPSGCGKSTLLALVGGLEAPTAGRVFVDGEELSGLSDRERARLRRQEFGFVFQSDSLLPFLTVIENVGLQLALHGASDDCQRSLELLADLGVADHADKLPDQLSGGERQRVAVARALVHEPRLILADEPTGSLDARNSEVVIDLLVAAQREVGATLLVVTHDPGVARRMDRELGLRDGQLVYDASRLQEPQRRRSIA
ncbi:MAG: ABC transporter ATP-binding protein [Solirubrobacterales bacterium]